MELRVRLVPSEPLGGGGICLGLCLVLGFHLSSSEHGL